MIALWVAVAGGLGSLVRYLVGLGSERWLGLRFPWGTLTVNVLGSLAIGLAFAAFEARGELDSRARIAVTTGFLGGFTTYSAFALESLQLLQRRSAGMFAAYVGVTLLVALGACYLGYAGGGRAFGLSTS